MDHWLRTAVTSLLLALVPAKCLHAQPADTLRILAIGNSFSVNALNSNFSEIAAADGQYVIIGNMYIGGCSLQRHFLNSADNKAAYSYYKRHGVDTLNCTKNFTLEAALADERWDIVTFQQSSPLSGSFSTYIPYIDSLVRYVHTHIGDDVRLMWHQTWAYAGDAGHPNFKDYNCNQHKMYRCIMSASRKCCHRFKFGVIPCGTAIQNLRLSEVGDNCTRDGYHLNTVGCYTAALTWWEAVSGHNVLTNGWDSPKLSATECSLARRAAHNACGRPFQLSDDAF